MNVIEAPSENFDQRTGPPDMIILHYTGMRTGEEALARLQPASPLAEMRRQIGARAPDYPSLAELAQIRGVSERTLKRQLTPHGGYRALLEEVRRDRAFELLAGTELNVERVAAEVGYSDTANFHRAFRRWAGCSPRSYRRTKLAQACA